MAYLDYKDYLAMGGTIDDSALYDRHCAQADALITRMTHGRALSETPARPCVQYAAYALIEAAYNDEQSGAEGREVASVSNDGVSVTYTQGSGGVGDLRAKRYAGIVRRFLEWETDADGTLFLYAGVDA